MKINIKIQVKTSQHIFIINYTGTFWCETTTKMWRSIRDRPRHQSTPWPRKWQQPKATRLTIPPWPPDIASCPTSNWCRQDSAPVCAHTPWAPGATHAAFRTSSPGFSAHKTTLMDFTHTKQRSWILRTQCKVQTVPELAFNNQSINKYFMSVHIKVILDKNKTNKNKHIIIIYTNFPTELGTINLTFKFAFNLNC